MNYQRDNNFINYYEVLNVAENASTSELQTALETYRQSMRQQLGNPLNMQSARYTINVTIPNIEKCLLSGDEARRNYDLELAVVRKQAEQSVSDEPAEHEGLDLRIQQPFFFDPYNGYDTEPATFTLRDIARRLDEDWTQTRIWFMNTSSRIHPLIGYLIYAALRPRLAASIGQIMQQVMQRAEEPMDINEGIEQCITIFNPDINRPFVAIESPHFDGQVLDLGTFLPEPRKQAQSEFTLLHHGTRGCAFGSIESLTPWITFPKGKSVLRFALMPEGAAASNGPSKITVPLLFQFHTLPHKEEYTGELMLRLDNWDPPLISKLPVVLYLAALPPRVWFEPAATAVKPLQVQPTRQGEVVKVVVIPRNRGDEAYIPLMAKITSEDNGATASPEYFRADQPITLVIDTSNRSHGKVYDITYNIDYRPVTGAEGQETIHVRGGIIPNFWQSMFRARTVGSRLVVSCLLGVGGFFTLGLLGDILAVNMLSAWVLLFLVPLILLGTTNLSITPIITHLQQSGIPEMDRKKISPYIKWVFPLALGFLLALLCGLVHNTNTAFVMGGIVGALAGIVPGFLFDGVKK